MNELINGSGNEAFPFIGAALRLLQMSKGLSGLQTAVGQWGTEALWVKRFVKGTYISITAPSGEHGGGFYFTGDLEEEVER
jgi:hypothetical protein